MQKRGINSYIIQTKETRAAYIKSKPKKERVELKDFKNIQNDYVKFFMDKIFEGETMMLPCRFGSIRIKGKKRVIKRDAEGRINNLPVDWKATKAYWEEFPEAKEQRKRLFFSNEHTDGYSYKFLWSKKDAYFKNKFMYYITLSRQHKKKLSDLLHAGVSYQTED